MGWTWIAAAFLGWLVTLAAGTWTGWILRREHEDARVKAPARDGGRGPSPAPAPRPPLLPFPGQWALEIDVKEDPFQGRSWLDTLLEENGVSRDRS